MKDYVKKKMMSYLMFFFCAIVLVLLVMVGRFIFKPTQIVEVKTKQSIDSVVVGMTYDEVQSILGRPSIIERGVRELHADKENSFMESSTFQSLDGASKMHYLLFVSNEIKNKNQKLWLDMPKIQLDGSWVSSVWYYDTTTVGIKKSFSVDTIQVIEPQLNTDERGHLYLMNIETVRHFVIYIKAIIFDVASGRVMRVEKVPGALL